MIEAASEVAPFAFEPPCWTIVAPADGGGPVPDYVILTAGTYGRVFPLYTDAHLAERAVMDAGVPGGAVHRFGDREDLLAALRAVAAAGAAHVAFDGRVSAAPARGRTRFAALGHVIAAVAGWRRVSGRVR